MMCAMIRLGHARKAWHRTLRYALGRYIGTSTGTGDRWSVECRYGTALITKCRYRDSYSAIENGDRESPIPTMGRRYFDMVFEIKSELR